MFDHVDNLNAGAAAHYQQLLEEARIERLIRARKHSQAGSRSAIRSLLIAFGKLLIKLGQHIQTVYGVSPRPVADDEVPKFQVQ